jgi:membrane protease YdiL (CAAX protease family)
MQQQLIKHGWARVLLFLIFYVLLLIFNGTVISLISPQFPEISNQSVYFSIAINLFVSLILVLLFRKIIDRSSIKSLGFARKGYKREGSIGFITGILLCSVLAVILWLMQLLQWYRDETDVAVLLQVLFVFTVVAVAEELVFRGYILNNLLQSMNRSAALILSAIIFAVMHSLNPEFNLSAFLNILLAGLLLGINYIFTKNLWFGMMLHLSWNFVQGPVLGFKVSGLELPSLLQQNIRGSVLLTGGEFGLEASWLTAIVFGIAIPVFYLLFQKKYISEQGA